MFETAEVGDNVFHVGFGWGKIDSITEGKHDRYPIKVQFEKGKTDSFTITGKYVMEHTNPQLFWKRIRTSGYGAHQRPVPPANRMVEVNGKLYSEDTLQQALEAYIKE